MRLLLSVRPFCSNRAARATTRCEPRDPEEKDKARQRPVARCHPGPTPRRISFSPLTQQRSHIPAGPRPPLPGRHASGPFRPVHTSHKARLWRVGPIRAPSHRRGEGRGEVAKWLCRLRLPPPGSAAIKLTPPLSPPPSKTTPAFSILPSPSSNHPIHPARNPSFS
jgi:hypothetical protein